MKLQQTIAANIPWPTTVKKQFFDTQDPTLSKLLQDVFFCEHNIEATASLVAHSCLTLLIDSFPRRHLAVSCIYQYRWKQTQPTKK